MTMQTPELPPLPPLGQGPPAPTPPPDIPPEVIAWLQSVPPEGVVAIVLAMVAVGGSLLFLMVRAIARRIEGGGGIRALREEVEILRQRVGDLESGQVHLTELEERVEFNERLLAQQRAAVRHD